MSSSQELPMTGAPTAAIGIIGAVVLALGAMLVATAQWGAKLRTGLRRSAA